MSGDTVRLRKAESRQFTPARPTRLSSVSRHAPLAERVEALEEEAHKLALLLEMSRSLSSEMELDAVMSLIVDHTTRIMGCERSSVFLLDKPRNELYALVAQGLEVKELRFGTQSGIAGYVAREGVGLNVPDAYKDPRFNPGIDKSTGYHTVSLLCMPLHDRRNQTLGVIQCLNKKGPHGKPVAFTPKDEVVLSAVASQAAVYLDNTALRRQMDLLFEAFVEAISRAIEDRDPCTSGHSRRVMLYSLALARAVHDCATPPFDQISYTRPRLRQLRYACLLHDVGKIGVREYILCKAARLPPHDLEIIRERLAVLRETRRADCLARAQADGAGAAELMAREHAPFCAELEAALNLVERCNAVGFLGDTELAALECLRARGLLTTAEFHNLSVRRGNLTPEEWEDMRSHVARSWRLLAQIPWPGELGDVAEIAYAHHERCDGSGYPRRLKQHEIHLDGQIISVADVYDALTAADRPYKKATPHDKARLILLEEEAGKGRILPALVNLFFSAECFNLPADARKSAGASGLLSATKA